MPSTAPESSTAKVCRVIGTGPATLMAGSSAHTATRAAKAATRATSVPGVRRVLMGCFLYLNGDQLNGVQGRVVGTTRQPRWQASDSSDESDREGVRRAAPPRGRARPRRHAARHARPLGADDAPAGGRARGPAERDLPPLPEQAGPAGGGRRRDPRPRTASEWPDRLREVCSELRHAMLACTDGADVVATVWAFGLGAAAPVAEMEKILADADVPEELVAVASRTLVHYVFGHAFEEQTARQAVGLGAVERSLDSLPDFDLGLDLVIDGLRARLA